ncbi:MAG: SDR family oxidoreductase [Roseibium sp.]|nr:SDR family oxidoreductase [Roseibium sp.]
MKFENQTVAITGGNSGIGRAAAADFRQAGAKVSILGRSEVTVASVSRELGVDGYTGDTTKTEDLDRFFAAVSEKAGQIDVLVANAGIAEFLPFEATDMDHFERTMSVNFLGTVATIKAALPYLATPASIVLTTSIASQLGEPNTSAYSASKAAMASLVRTLSRELLPKGIRLNAVSPGPTVTPIFEKMGLEGEVLDQTHSALSGVIPAGRMGTVADQASAILFLAAKENDFVVGQELTVDGGIVGCAAIGA